MKKMMLIATMVFVVSTFVLVYLVRQKLEARAALTAPPTANTPTPLTPAPALARAHMPEFTLTTQEEKPLTRADLLGKVTIVDFMFTYCPFICPRLTATMNSMAQKLEGTSVRFLSVSVDPAHDTPQRLKAYAAD